MSVKLNFTAFKKKVNKKNWTLKSNKIKINTLYKLNRCHFGLRSRVKSKYLNRKKKPVKLTYIQHYNQQLYNFVSKMVDYKQN